MTRSAPARSARLPRLVVLWALPIATAAWIIEHFGGRLWLESTRGRGACFGFHLPWAPPAAQD